MSAKASPQSTASSLFKIVLALYVAAISYAVWQGVTKPVRNWDMLGYMGSIVSMTEKDPLVIHSKVLEEVKPVVWPQLYEDFAIHNDLSNDPHDFYLQIPFYDIKPLYVASVWLVHKMGAGLAESTWLVSTVSFIVLAITLVLWRPQNASRTLWLAGLIAVMMIGRFGIKILAGYSTPDALHLAFMMLGLMVWLKNKSFLGYALCVILAVFARPDGLIQSITLTGYLAVFAAPSRRLTYTESGAIIAVIILSYLGIRWIIGSVEWSTLFYRSFIDMNFDFTQTKVHITWDQYWGALKSGVIHQFENVRLLTFAALSSLALVCHFQFKCGRKEWMWMLVMAWATLVVRFLLFPGWGDERYYFYYYLISLMASIEILAPLFTQYKLVKR